MKKPNLIKGHKYIVSKNDGSRPFAPALYIGTYHNLGTTWYSFSSQLALSPDMLAEWSITPENPETPSTGFECHICGYCRHFNPTVTTSKTWGKCENKKNNVRVIGLNVVNMYIPDEAGRKEVRDHFDNSIRYPDNFGCIFFEAL